MKLKIKDGAAGKGVFAEESIPAGALIIRFTGPFLRYKDTTPNTYALQIGPDLYIGASGSFDDFVNHSCNPNAGMRIRGVTVDLYALRDITPGEEICFDYSTTMDEDDFEFVCRCGNPGCRKIIRDGKHLPEHAWNKYEALDILPDYVRQSRIKK